MSASDDSLLWGLLILVAALVLAPVLLMLLLVPAMGVGMMGSGMGPRAVSPVAALLSGLVPLVVLVGLGYLAYRVLAGRSGPGGRDRAVEELRMALARGDLSREEYEQRRELLEREE